LRNIGISVEPDSFMVEEVIDDTLNRIIGRGEIDKIMFETGTQIKVQIDKNSLKILGRAETIDMAKRKINPLKIQDPMLIRSRSHPVTPEASNSCFQSTIQYPVIIRSRPVTPEAETDNFSSSPTTTEIIKFRGFEYFLMGDQCRTNLVNKQKIPQDCAQNKNQ
jgi:hypothetical protein